MVPFGADALKGQTEWRTGARRKRSGAEVYRIIVTDGLLKNSEGQILYLRDLPHGIFESHTYDGMGKGFVSGVGHSSIYIVDRSPNKIFRSAGLEIGDFDISYVGRRRSCNFRFLPEKENGESNHD